MAEWAWWVVLAIVLVGWSGTGWWVSVYHHRLLARVQAHALTTADLSSLTAAHDHLQADHRAALAAWAAEVARTRTDWQAEVARLMGEIAALRTDAAALRTDGAHLRAALDESADHVSALSHATALSQAAIQARTDWANAFNRNFTPSTDTDPVPPKGWTCVLQSGNVVESVRAIRDGNAPTRIARQHGDHSDWYRLTRVDGLSLIYEPELNPN